MPRSKGEKVGTALTADCRNVVIRFRQKRNSYCKNESISASDFVWNLKSCKRDAEEENAAAAKAANESVAEGVLFAGGTKSDSEERTAGEMAAPQRGHASAAVLEQAAASARPG